MKLEKDRISKLKDFEKSLAELVAVHTPEFQAAVREQLSLEERAIYDKGICRYSQETGRWFDPWGIPDSILDFKRILNQEGLSERDKLLALAILIYHDSGYPSLNNSAEYVNGDIRELHMRIGAKNFIEDLSNFRFKERFVFDRIDLVRGVEVIARHDEKYLEHKVKSEYSELLKIFMDGDNIWVPNFISAYKDFVSRYTQPDKSNMSGEDFLRMRQSCFFVRGEDREYGQSICITEESDAKYGSKLLSTRFKTTKQVFAVHMLARTCEFRDGLFDLAFQGNWEDFKKYTENYLRGSIFSARNGKSYDTEIFEREVLEKSQKRS